jgi:hypothetical protein
MAGANSSVMVKRSNGRSRMSNGTVLLEGVDGRNSWSRRLRDLLEIHTEDLGGEANTSAAERSIICRAATLTVELERMESRFALADGADPDALDLYGRTAGNLRRLLESVGIRRRPRAVLSLSEYLNGKAEAGDALDAEIVLDADTATAERREGSVGLEDPSSRDAPYGHGKPGNGLQVTRRPRMTRTPTTTIGMRADGQPTHLGPAPSCFAFLLPGLRHFYVAGIAHQRR